MGKPNSSGEQLFRSILLAVGLTLIFFQFFGKGQKDANPPRKALTLAQAFKGIDPAQGPPLTQAQAYTEIGKLESQISTSEHDPLALWSKLRIGLIQQYILPNGLKTATRKSGILGFGSDVTYFPAYDDLTRNTDKDETVLPLEAQALYQVGDLQWRQSLKTDPKGSVAAGAALEALIHKGRGSSLFLDQQIFVPKEKEPSKVPLNGVPPSGFELAKIRDLNGTLAQPLSDGILDRVNAAYSQTVYYTVFDAVVKALGANPGYSYGIAILIFAVFTRTALQPLYKRQYDSMKGLALIQPEMKKIQEKYKGNTDNAAQMQQMKEIQALQRRHGVNPLMGCFLGLLQMPIFFVFVYPLIQHYEPKMELAQATFLWVANLSHPDIPLLILYGLSMFFSFRLSSTPPTDESQRQQQLIMSFMLPVMLPFFLKSYPSAFTMYWMTYNALSTVFQWRLAKAADPKKSLVKTLMGVELAPGAPIDADDVDSVPQRPRNGKVVEGKNVTLDKNGASNGKADSSLDTGNAGLNGSLNGNGHSKNGAAKNGASKNGAPNNGAPKKAAENGSVLKSGSNKKKK